jgi:hypothetical protein
MEASQTDFIGGSSVAVLERLPLEEDVRCSIHRSS